MKPLRDRWADVLRALELVLATPLLLLALYQSPRRWGIVALSLLLLGVVSLDAVIAWLPRPRRP